MPDIFQAPPDTDRDQRFRDAKLAEEQKQTPIVTPSPVEPYLSEQAEIPLAPVLRKPKHTKMHIFTSYCELPPNVTFENQENNERILLFLRRSFITNLSWIFFSIILLILPFAIMVFYPSFLSLLPSPYIIMITLFYFLALGTYFFVNFITWYFKIVLITDQRIVDIDFEDLVYKNIAETKMDLVQDVSYTETGVIRTIFDYGDILVQTAGTIDNFDLHAIPLPERVENILEDLIGKGRGVPNA